MSGHPFYIVDVFAETKYAGNQLAVVDQAADLTSTEMQSIAREMNYSETTFILSGQENNGGFDVRIFSLDEELPFAGHPTLGTAFIIQQFLLEAKIIPEVRLNLPVGQIPVTISYQANRPEIMWMKLVAPQFGKQFAAEDAARALNLDEVMIDRRFPVEEVSTGLPFIIIPLVSLEAVRSCRVDQNAYLKLIDQAEAKSLFVFCPETYLPENHFNCRMFDHFHGIPEDPATGSANGCFAAYLVKNCYLGSTAIDVRVEQGYEIGRPSLLLLKASAEKGGIAIEVGGKTILVARGQLL